MPKANRTRQNDPLTEEEMDRKKSLADWSKESTETLKLKCNTYRRVVTGRRNLLANRLFNYFHPQGAEEETAVTNEPRNRGHNVVPNNMVDSNSGSATNELVLARMDALTSMVSTLKNRVDDQGVRVASANSNVQQVGTNNVGPAYGYVNPAFLQLGNANSNPAFGATGMDNTLVRNPAFSPSANDNLIPTFSATGIDNTSTSVSTAATATPVSTVTRYAETPSSSASTSKGNISINYGGMVIDNPFLLPPVKGPIEKKLENGDFLDFEDLMPTQTSSATSNELYLMAENNSDPNALVTPLMLKTRDSKGKVTNLANWLFAWNSFMEGTLSFKPHLVHDLFM